MKKLLGLLLLIIPFTAGCATVDTMLTINDDNSATVVSSVTYKGDLSQTDNEKIKNFDLMVSKFIDKTYIVNSAFGEKLSTITATKEVKNLKHKDLDLSSLGFETKLPDNKFVEIRKNFIISSYNVDAVYDFEKQAKKYEEQQKKLSDQTTSTLDPEYFRKYGLSAETEEQDIDKSTEFDFLSNLDESVKMLFKQDAQDAAQDNDDTADDNLTLSFSIKVPGIASYNNADEVKGNVYTWNIKQDEPTEIKFQYVRYSGLAIAIIILAGVLLLVYVAKRILRRDTTKRIDNIENIV